MIRTLVLSLGLLAWTTAAQAHFVFVVPGAGIGFVYAVLSENLLPDNEVDVGMIAGLSLTHREPGGHATPVALTRGAKDLHAPLPGGGVVHGMVDLGVTTRGDVPHVLRYYPKAVLGPADGAPVVGVAPVELVAARYLTAWRIQFRVNGRPQAGATVNVLFPGRDELAMTTNAEGWTDVLPSKGMYGAWARHWEDDPGTRDGKAYAQVRHYATLVFDSTAVAPSPAEAPPGATRVSSLPEATSSFGASVLGDWMYVYGGHIAPTHVYHREAVSGRLARFNLKDRRTWQTLPSGTPAQGLNLLTHQGHVYRVGGMQPLNSRDDGPANRSMVEVARFDPATLSWAALPPLTYPRSSHDVVSVGSKIFVVGGWALGPAVESWADWMEVLDTSAETPAWTRVPQPFRRRALITVANDRRIYVIGGFDETSQVVRAVSIYDVDRGTWSEGPTLPGGGVNGFAPAACVANGRVVVSLADGALYRLDAAERAWEKVGEATPRVAHRLVPDGDAILVVGGADKGANLDLVESVTLPRTRP